MIIDTPWMPRLVPVASLGGAVAASTAEVTAGSDNAKFITPAALEGSNPVFAAGTVPDQIAASTNGRAPAQGLVFNGTAGATVANVPAFGTGDFTVAAWVTPSTVAATQAIVSGGSNSFGFRISSPTGALAVGKVNASDGTPSTGTIAAGKTSLVAYVRSGALGTYYINGVAAGTSDETGLDYSAALAYIGSFGATVTQVMSGGLRPLIENRALTAAEVLRLYERGAPDAGDYNNASNTSIINDPGFGTAIDAGNWKASVGTPVIAGGKLTCEDSDIAYYDMTSIGLLQSGQKCRFTVTIDSISAGSARYYNGSAYVIFATEAGTYTVEFTALAATHVYLRAVGGTAVFDNYNAYRLGLLLAPESNAPGNGYQWKDMSGNKADITLPASGVEWALPDVRNNQLRATLTWAASHEAKSIGLIPANAVIMSIQTTASANSAGSGMTIGSVTTPNLLVAAAAYTTAKKVQTLAAQLPAGSATNDLTLVLDPDTQNYTGSIQVAINYLLAQ
jgi:hypothetical protein